MFTSINFVLEILVNMQNFNENNKYRVFLQRLKKEYKISSRKISDDTKIPISTIEKIASGRIKNPRKSTIEKIMKTYNITPDKMHEYSNLKPYYIDSKTEKLLRNISCNPILGALCEATLNLNKSDIKAIIEIAKRMDKK